MSYDTNAIEISIFKAVKEMEKSDKEAFDIAFHMTNWLDDLAKLQEFYVNPGNFDNDEIFVILSDFLVYAPDHLAAAGMLVLGLPVTDVFNVGAVSESYLSS